MAPTTVFAFHYNKPYMKSNKIPIIDPFINRIYQNLNNL